MAEFSRCADGKRLSKLKSIAHCQTTQTRPTPPSTSSIKAVPVGDIENAAIRVAMAIANISRTCRPTAQATQS
jgi:hypothetical protein